jgi:hypothetical protein
MAMAKKPDQIKQFRKTARALECDEDADRFNSVLGKVARTNPQPAKEAKPRTRGKARRERRAP